MEKILSITFEYLSKQNKENLFGVFMVRTHFNIALIRNTFKQRKFFAQFTKIPILGRIIDKLFFDGDDILFLPKDSVVKKTIEINETIIKPDDIVLPTDIVKHFINQSKYHFLMNFCICRVSNKCEDYPINLGCLFLGEAVKKIDPSVGKLVTKEEALVHVDRCKDAGLVHLIGRNKLDGIWLNAGPKEKLMTICNCCNCCCLWRMIPNLSKNISSKITKMPGVNVFVNSSECIGCGRCVKSCFVDAIQIINDKAKIDSLLCRACGRCVEICPEKAIVLEYSSSSNTDSLKRINPLIDLQK